MTQQFVRNSFQIQNIDRLKEKRKRYIMQTKSKAQQISNGYIISYSEQRKSQDIKRPYIMVEG